VRGAKIETINFLLDSGADINMEDKKFTTPLLVAKKSSKPQVINLLVSRGAKTSGNMIQTSNGGSSGATSEAKS
jgi:ankyrin repeat protein